MADEIIVLPQHGFGLPTPRFVQRQQDAARNIKQTPGKNGRALARPDAAIVGERA